MFKLHCRLLILNCFFKGLEHLHEDLSVLEVLVYEVGLTDLSLEDIEQLNTLEKASLFMSKVCKINLTNFSVLYHIILYLYLFAL